MAAWQPACTLDTVFPGPSLPACVQMRKQLAPMPKPDKARDATAFDAFLGAAQAAGLGMGLLFFSTKMTALIGTSPLPEAYTARNISVAVRTMIEGLSWLATFVFLLNAVGLTGEQCALRENAADVAVFFYIVWVVSMDVWTLSWGDGALVT